MTNISTSINDEYINITYHDLYDDAKLELYTNLDNKNDKENNLCVEEIETDYSSNHENIDENIYENIDENIDKNIDKNIDENIDMDMHIDIDKNIDKDKEKKKKLKQRKYKKQKKYKKYNKKIEEIRSNNNKMGIIKIEVDLIKKDLEILTTEINKIKTIYTTNYNDMMILYNRIKILTNKKNNITQHLSYLESDQISNNIFDKLFKDLCNLFTK